MILKTISTTNKPFIKDNLIQVIEEQFKKELCESNDFMIESDYIKNLIEKLIDELEQEKQMYF
jgi:predicted urease superfamily metal-dependent hydrolase